MSLLCSTFHLVSTLLQIGSTAIHHIFFFLKELHEAVNIEACFISFLKEAMAHYTHYSEIFLLFQYILDISPYKYMRRYVVLHCRDLS